MMNSRQITTHEAAAARSATFHHVEWYFSLKLWLTLKFFVLKYLLFLFWQNCSESNRNLKNNVNGFSLIDIHQTQVWPSVMKSDGSRVSGNRCNLLTRIFFLVFLPLLVNVCLHQRLCGNCSYKNEVYKKALDNNK